MPSVDVFDLNNQKVGTLELADAVFGAESMKRCCTKRSGTFWPARAPARTRPRPAHEVAGSGKKLWKQKGTGRARMGSIRSPLWRHGGTTHGPQPRDYCYTLPKKMMMGALRSALSAKLRDGELQVVQAFTLADHKTKSTMGTLATLEAGRTVLLVDNGENRNLELGRATSKGVKLVAQPRRERLRSARPQERAAERSRGPEVLGGPRKMTLYRSISSRPIVTEKGVTKKDTERTLCFEVSADANKTQIRQPSRSCSR